jgi:hypothetical protein
VKICSWRFSGQAVKTSARYLADLAAMVSLKPSFNCESSSSAMVITSSGTAPKFTLPRLVCSVFKMPTCPPPSPDGKHLAYQAQTNDSNLWNLESAPQAHRR